MKVYVFEIEILKKGKESRKKKNVVYFIDEIWIKCVVLFIFNISLGFFRCARFRYICVY